MSSLDLAEIVQTPFAGDRDHPAMVESVEICNKRFAEVGIAPTLENRHAYRDWIIRTPQLNDSIGGAILFDETMRQTSADGKSFCQLATARPMRRSTSGSTNTFRRRPSASGQWAMLPEPNVHSRSLLQFSGIHGQRHRRPQEYGRKTDPFLSLS